MLFFSLSPICMFLHLIYMYEQEKMNNNKVKESVNVYSILFPAHDE